MGCEESKSSACRLLLFLLFLSWLLASAFPSFLSGYRSAATPILPARNSRAGCAGLHSFCLSSVFIFLKSPLNCGSATQASRNHGRHGK